MLPFHVPFHVFNGDTFPAKFATGSLRRISPNIYGHYIYTFQIINANGEIFFNFFPYILDLVFNISPLPLLEWVSTCFANLFFAEQLLHNQGSDSGRYMYLKKAFPDEISCMEIQGFFRVEILYYHLRDTAKYVFL